MTTPPSHTSSDSRKRVILFCDSTRTGVVAEQNRLTPLLERHADVFHVDLTANEDFSHTVADFAVVLGGDGSILRAAGQMGYRQLPVVGVNLGKLGFLADLSPEELLEVFPKICQQAYPVVEHLILQCRVMVSSQPLAAARMRVARRGSRFA